MKIADIVILLTAALISIAIAIGVFMYTRTPAGELILYYAPWCGYCQKLLKDFETNNAESYFKKNGIKY